MPPYPALIIMALFVAIIVCGAVGAWRHFAGKARGKTPR